MLQATNADHASQKKDYLVIKDRLHAISGKNLRSFIIKKLHSSHSQDVKLAVVPSQCWCMFRSRLAEKAEVYILVCIIVRIPSKLSPLWTHYEKLCVLHFWWSKCLINKGNQPHNAKTSHWQLFLSQAWSAWLKIVNKWSKQRWQPFPVKIRSFYPSAEQWVTQNLWNFIPPNNFPHFKLKLHETSKSAYTQISKYLLL